MVTDKCGGRLLLPPAVERSALSAPGDSSLEGQVTQSPGRPAGTPRGLPVLAVWDSWPSESKLHKSWATCGCPLPSQPSLGPARPPSPPPHHGARPRRSPSLPVSSLPPGVPTPVGTWPPPFPSSHLCPVRQLPNCSNWATHFPPVPSAPAPCFFLELSRTLLSLFSRAVLLTSQPLPGRLRSHGDGSDPHLLHFPYHTAVRAP